ncbi:MAG: dihydroorotase, partial [Rhodothalassiaceae bacterium]
MSTILIDNVRLVDPASGRDGGGRVLVENGRISAIDPRRVPGKGVQRIDGHGHILAPGLIDMRSFAVDASAALAGGITTVVLMPDQEPAIDTAAKVQFARDPDPSPPSVRVEVMGAATQETAGAAMAEIGLMAEAGAIGFSDGRRAIAGALLMRRLLEYARLVDRPVVQHAEDPALAAGGAMNEGEIATRLGLPGIPAAAEAIMIERDARLVRLTGGRLHIAQVSAAESVEVLRRIRREDGTISAGASPHHFTLNETAVGDYRTFAKVSPPLRGEDDRRALVEAIREGLIDVICSAHEPRDQDAKRLPFSEAAPGIVGYETLLPLTLALH